MQVRGRWLLRPARSYLYRHDGAVATSYNEARMLPVTSPEHPVHPMAWADLAASAARSTSSVEHSWPTPLAEPPVDVIARATAIAAGRAPCEAAQEICRFGGENMRYLQGVTGVKSTARDAWADNRLGGMVLRAAARLRPDQT